MGPMNALAQSSMLRSTNKPADSLSQNSKSMSKLSDNNSDSNFNEKTKYLTKFGGDATSKNHSFVSDAEESVHSGLVTNGLPSLPPIFLPGKKKKKGYVH